jgi:hypothetical protein
MNTRLQLLIIGALPFLALLACDKRGPTRVAMPQQQSVEQEAVQKVREDFERAWLKKGDSWFGIYTKGLGQHVIEAKGIAFKALQSPMGVSSADRLNGIDWSGTVEIDATVYRKKPIDRSGDWGEWKNGLPGIPFPYNLQKKKGQWTIQESETLSDRPPSPEELGIAEKHPSP